MAEKKTESAKKTATIRLPRNPGQNANQDEFFSVNFKNYMIKRGEYIEVPDEIAALIMDNEQAEDAALRFIEANGMKTPGKE